MGLPQLDSAAVEERLVFAARRAGELYSLNGGDLARADSSERQQLVQEFFFHLLGAVDVLAQLTNERLGLGQDPNVVTMGLLIRRIGTNPIKAKLELLYANPSRAPMPTDPYSDEGYLYRAYNYRHQVTHRRAVPWLFRVGSGPMASFILDPRDPPGNGPNHSVKPYDAEMNLMLALIKRRVSNVIDRL